jgi:hypothetical protein
MGMVGGLRVVDMSVPSTSGARLLKALMGLVIILAGSLFVGLLWLSYQRAQETRQWPAVDGLVLLSEVVSEKPTVHSEVAHRAAVRYSYEFKGVRHTGTRVKRVEGASSDRSKAQKVVDAYPPGKRVTCFVNPEQPDFAILEHATKAGLYSIWFPLLFVVGGAGMVWSAFRAPR